MISKIIIDPLSQHAESFAMAVFKAFAPFCKTIAFSLVGLWLAKAIYDAVFIGEFDLRHVIRKILIFSVVALSLQAQESLYWDYVHGPIKETSASLIEEVVSMIPQSTENKIESSKKLIDVFERAVNDLTRLLLDVCSKAGIFSSILAMILSAIIWVGFVASLSIFSLYWIANTLKLCALSALSPLLILACLFEKTRGHALSGIKYVLTSVLLLLIASFCIGLVLFALRNVLSMEDTSDFLSTLSTLFFVALSSVYFLMLAPEMASVIMGSQSGSTLPGMVGGAMAAGAGGIIGGVGILANMITKGAMRGASSLSNNIRNRFSKNYTPAASPRQP